MKQKHIMKTKKPFAYFLTTLCFLATLTNCNKEDDADIDPDTNQNSNTQVSTFAGSSMGYIDDIGENAEFNYPTDLVADSQGNLYVADEYNHKIRKITPNGVVTTLAGSTDGDEDGTGVNAKFFNPSAITIDQDNNLYVADTHNNKIRKITPTGIVTTIAGSTEGYEDGTGTDAKFSSPRGIKIDTQGNIFVTDYYNHRIRKINPNGVVSTLAGSTPPGYADGMGEDAKFSNLGGITIDSQGNLYVSDGANHKVRKITSNGQVSTLAGSTQGYANGTGTSAKFDRPYGITIDSQDNLYVVDNFNSKIRKVSPSGSVSTVAGATVGGTDSGAADGPVATAQFYLPTGITINNQGVLYLADRANHKIRKITRE